MSNRMKRTAIASVVAALTLSAGASAWICDAQRLDSATGYKIGLAVKDGGFTARRYVNVIHQYGDEARARANRIATGLNVYGNEIANVMAKEDRGRNIISKARDRGWTLGQYFRNHFGQGPVHDGAVKAAKSCIFVGTTAYTVARAYGRSESASNQASVAGCTGGAAGSIAGVL